MVDNKEVIRKLMMLKETSNLFWSSYQHIYDVRERESKDRINILLIISTFLPILSVTLYGTGGIWRNEILLIPIIPQIIAIIYLLKYFYFEDLGIPLLSISYPIKPEDEQINYLKEMDQNKFYITLISVLKEQEHKSYQKIRNEGEIINYSRKQIIISLFLFISSILLIIIKINLIQGIIILCLLYGILFFYEVYNKPQQISLREEEKANSYYGKINNWINSCK